MGASGIFIARDSRKIQLEPLTDRQKDFDSAYRENKAVDTSVEHGALYDKNGEPIVGYKGDRHSIPVDRRVLENEGGSFTHYHPDNNFGGTLSMADLKVFANSKLNSLTAVSSQGQLYSIKANSNLDRAKLGKWINKNQKLAQKNFNKSYESALKRAITPLKSGPHKGQIKLTDANGKTVYRQPMTPKEAANFARRYSVGMFERMYKKNLGKLGVTYTSTKAGISKKR